MGFQDELAQRATKFKNVQHQNLGKSAIETFVLEKQSEFQRRQAAAYKVTVDAMVSVLGDTQRGMFAIYDTEDTLMGYKEARDLSVAAYRQRELERQRPQEQIAEGSTVPGPSYEDIRVFAQKAAMEWEQEPVKTQEKLLAFTGTILDMYREKGFSPAVGRLIIEEFHKLRP